MPNEKSRLVYSTDQKTPRQDKSAEKALPADVRPAQQKVIVRLDRKSRGGKSVTVIEGLLMPQREMEALLKQFKDRLGTGGTVKDIALEIQGDHRDTLMEVLEKMGYRPKRSGG
jgi:translation initiation factor 1